MVDSWVCLALGSLVSVSVELLVTGMGVWTGSHQILGVVNHMGSRKREVRETGHVCWGRGVGGRWGAVRGGAWQWGGEKSFVCTGLGCQHKCGFGGSCRPPFLI